MPTLPPGVWFFLALAAFCAIGIVVLIRSARALAAELAFAAEYRDRVHTFVKQADAGAYEWLTLNANRMQLQMGSQGLMTFKPPFANHMIHNYPVVLNVLPELRKCLTDHVLSRSLLGEYHALIDEALLRHQGSLLQRHSDAVSFLWNPVVWLTSGIRSVLAAPLWFLASAGQIPRSIASRVAASRFYRVVAGLVAAIGFTSAIVTLVTGWEQFVSILRRLLPSAF
ncbi:MAG: hypothetical protein ABS56_12700 [Lautropia sp. SCN 69-89]|nr:MAG: hypothetical protein ABS56_12700 [Lautropia sp. SCN 69-89]